MQKFKSVEQIINQLKPEKPIYCIRKNSIRSAVKHFNKNFPGKIFKRDEIASLIDLNKERSIDVIVTRLRKKIEETPKSPKYLQTIRGEGYVLWIE